MTPVSGDQCSIVFQDEQITTHKHNFKDLGTGVEQLLMTLVVGLTQSAAAIILEEPETGLHAGAQRALLGLLQDWSTDRLFVASTHSATMLDWTSPTTAVVSVSRKGTDSIAMPVTTERADVLRELGVRLSDVLSAERILILEGPTDKEIFDAWFPEVTRSPHVVVVDGGGGYNARHADLFVKWLDDVDQLGARRVLYARDADELSAKFLQRLEESSHVHVLPGREIENLLLDFEAIAAVINFERGKVEKDAIKADAVATMARQLADGLKPTVVLKRVMAGLADPIRLVDNDLRRRLSKSKADETALSGEVLKRVPDKDDLKAIIVEKWQHNAKEVEDAWEKGWLRIAPGADLLSALWKKYLDRGYSKSVDGLAIAKRMDPPSDLASVLQEFMSAK
jgi:hypothetical protein